MTTITIVNVEHKLDELQQEHEDLLERAASVQKRSLLSDWYLQNAVMMRRYRKSTCPDCTWKILWSRLRNSTMGS